MFALFRRLHSLQGYHYILEETIKQFYAQNSRNNHILLLLCSVCIFNLRTIWYLHKLIHVEIIVLLVTVK